MTVMKEARLEKCGFEDAMEVAGFGKYNIGVLITCCLLILAMFVDIFGLSVVLPAVSCELQLTTTQQGLLSALPLIGVMLFSYGWGLCADTLGRRATLLLAMPVGCVFGLASSMAPGYTTFAVLKFLSAACTSSASAAGFVLLGESVPRKYRASFMFVMTTTTMMSQMFLSLAALPILAMSFRIEIPWLSMEYRPWRLLLQVVCLPGILGCIFVVFLKESPKYLLCKNKEEDCLDALRLIYSYNSGMKKEDFGVTKVFPDELQVTSSKKSFLREIWSQTAPLFKPPLLKNNIMLFYLLLCAYMASTGYSMWVPTIANAFFADEHTSGKTFCEVASQSATTGNSTTTDCNHTIQPQALYATVVFSGACGVISALLGSIVGYLGKKTTTVMIYALSVIAGSLLLFIRIPMLSIALLCLFLYVAVIVGNVNTYLQDLNPTHLRGMATCLSVVVSRGFGFMSVQLIASLIGRHCTPMISGYVLLIASGLVVSLFLPSDKKEEKEVTCDAIVTSRENSEYNVRL